MLEPRCRLQEETPVGHARTAGLCEVSDDLQPFFVDGLLTDQAGHEQLRDAKRSMGLANLPLRSLLPGAVRELKEVEHAGAGEGPKEALDGAYLTRVLESLEKGRGCPP